LIPILNILNPIITFVAQGFVWLYNAAILPVANFMIMAANAMYNAIVWVINAIVNGINNVLGWMGVHLNGLNSVSLSSGTLSAISMQSLNQAGATAGSSGSSGSNTTYGQTAPVYNYITFNNNGILTGNNSSIDTLVSYMYTRMGQMISSGQLPAGALG
jgi:hypothetical protein